MLNDTGFVVRICILLESYYPVLGGMETQGRTLVSGLHAAGAEVVVVTRKTSPELVACEQLDGVSVYRCGPTGRSSRNRWLFMLSCVPRLIRLHKHYDVLLVSGFRVLGITGLLVGKLFRKSVWLKAECIGEMSGDFFTGGLEGMKLKRGFVLFRTFLCLRNHWLRKADRFISMYSEMDREFKDFGVPADKITTIANAVDVEKYAPGSPEERIMLRTRLGLPSDKILFIYTGRIVSYKGIPLMLDVWNGLRKRYADSALVIVGEGGVDVYNCERSARQFVERHGMAGQVIFTGPVTNVDEYMKGCDIFLLPTQNDAFPLCIIEAMASALPIITTPVGALKDVIHDQQNGLIVAPGDKEALQSAMIRLLEDDVLRKRLGQAAMEDAKKHYTQTAIVNEYLQLTACSEREE